MCTFYTSLIAILPTGLFLNLNWVATMVNKPWSILSINTCFLLSAGDRSKHKGRFHAIYAVYTEVYIEMN